MEKKISIAAEESVVLNKKKTNTGKCSEAQTVAKIVKMGYPEEDVKRALCASFNNLERAIEYLINGIPASPSTPEGNSTDADTSGSIDIMPYEFLRTDPTCRRLRRTIMRNPDFLETGVQRLGSLNMNMLRYLSENHVEFLNMLFEPPDDDDEHDQNDEEENQENKENNSNKEEEQGKEKGKGKGLGKGKGKGKGRGKK